jgi:chromosome segregation ATPase
MIAKVIEMLGEEKDKIKVDLAAEEKTMAEYMAWCDDTQDEYFYGIKSAKAKIEELVAVITDSAAQIASLDEEVAELGNEIAERQSDIEEAIAIRTKDHEEFLKVEAEQVAMVEELEEMGVALKKQISAFTQTPPPVAEGGEEGEAAEAAFLQKKSPAASFDAFLQIKSNTTDDAAAAAAAAKTARFNKLKKALQMMVTYTWVDPETKKRLASLQQSDALVQEEPNIDAHDGLPPGESAGGAMATMKADNEKSLEMFEGLKGKAEESLQKSRDEETKKQGEHDIQIMTLKQAISLAENDLDDAKKDHARISQEKAEAEEEKGDVEASKASDEKSLESTKQECDATSEAWANRQAEAKAEMAAIEKAKGILAARVTVFVQLKLKSMDPPADSVQETIKAQKTRQVLINHFRNLGNKLHSLAMLNLVTVAAQDPMANVKNLLKDLIAKLEKEAKEAADLHAFCQAEKKKTTAALKKKNMEIDKLSARIEGATTKKEQLEELIATSSAEIAETEKVNAEATKLRNEQNANFVKVDADFSGAAEAVDDAIDALKEYYGDALIQTSSKTDTLSDATNDAPPTFGGAKSDSAGGIMGILETMGEEFRKTVKENKASERENVKAYETLMNENKVVIATKEAEIKGAESEVKSLEVTIHDSNGDLKMVNKEKGAIEDYVEKLKPQCQGRVIPYEERKAKMEAEIAGLKDGLAILESESPSGAFASFAQVKQHTA